MQQLLLYAQRAAKDVSSYLASSLFGAVDSNTVFAPIPIVSHRGDRAQIVQWLESPMSEQEGLVAGSRYLILDFTRLPGVLWCQLSVRVEGGVSLTLHETKATLSPRTGPVMADIERVLRSHCNRNKMVAAILFIVDGAGGSDEQYIQRLLSELHLLVPQINAL